MIMSIVLAALPFVLKLVEWFLDKSKANAELKQKFFEFVKLAGKDFGSVKLMEHGDEQLKYLKENPWQESK